ncbi:conserved hypothetical protein [Trichophyton verrucosum HKI 0517]|uniref:Uncharacterized protein n=1 Tax=Trichophyton verrucosum (strain HKI 0517) TaxID=663202 RepID=D4D788_TRIVH|nr:uncharacterized protein TRV_02969 [Trichophyton verrucosum HKI 0517]EFE42269.1 conserved hypothetical protein [Trichophyton verrucosum HKI 0517]
MTKLLFYFYFAVVENRMEDDEVVIIKSTTPMDRDIDEKSARPGPIDASDRRGAKYRHANVYDAVAANDYHGITSTRIFPAVTPEEVLFRKQNAPVRYMENDFYFANEDIPEDQPLPDSDLLKAIHAYTSDLYANKTVDRGQSAWRSMDETALIALGFLLEETAVEALEETGDMALVEGAVPSDPEWVAEAPVVRSRETSVSAFSTRSRIDGYSCGGFDDVATTLSRQRKSKKRRRLSSLSAMRPASEKPAT